MLFWIFVIIIISILWAIISLKKERGKREINEARNEMARGKVIYHSSDVSDSSS
ncbi:MAG: hypothetical protein ACD_37C00579G0008 [uncultured bacterium]|nr:MAG: hypothetical protein ACD_37C00579G0008 [uncultured bacterium]